MENIPDLHGPFLEDTPALVRRLSHHAFGWDDDNDGATAVELHSVKSLSIETTMTEPIREFCVGVYNVLHTFLSTVRR